MQELRGKVALVTGGAQGLGEAISRTLAAAGAIVVPADLQEERAAAVVDTVRARGGDGMAVRLDVTDEQQSVEAVRRVVDTYDRLDILVNNAGIDRTVSIEELSVADW